MPKNNEPLELPTGALQVLQITVRASPEGIASAMLHPVGSMDDAIQIAMIDVAFLQLDEAVNDAWKTLLRTIAGAVCLDSFGVAPSYITEGIEPPFKDKAK